MKRFSPIVAGFSLLPLLFFSPHSQAENIVYPADSGVLNVKNAPFNAKGDGVTDDTAAIQSALAAGLNNHKVVYLPNGTYLVRDSLKWNNGTTGNGGWGRFLSLQGQSQAGTVLKLDNNAPGFTDANNPKAVVFTASGDDNNQYSDANGEGNQAFENHIRNLTVDTGLSNPGAVGIDYQVSNWGAMRDVTIRSSDAGHVGYCGINMQRRDNGPGLLKNVTIDGFQYGMIASQEIVQMTMENITLRNQSVVGISERDAIFAIRKLHSVNTVSAIRVDGVGLLEMMDADLNGGAATNSAIQTITTDSRAHLRNISTQGYASAVSNRGAAVPGSYLDEWTSDGVFSAFASPPASLRLPVRETPTYFDSTLTNWASVGPANGSNDTIAIQNAMNSGKSTVYFPSGTYNIGATVTVPSNVRLIVGMGTSLNATSNLNGVPMFRFAGGASSDKTIVDRFAVGANSSVFIEDVSPRALVLRDTGFFSGSIYRNGTGAGPFFIEDVAGASYQFNVPQKVWARQWNAEGSANPKVTSNGATIWALGLKTEGGDTIIDTENGGKTELWGGFLYTFGVSASSAAFINNASSVSLGFAGTTYVANGFYTILVQETRNGTTQNFTKSSAYGRGGGASVPLYTGYQPAAVQTLRLNAGGFVAVPFDGESILPTGNTGTYFTSDPIDTSGVVDPAPQAVYQSERDDLGGTAGSSFQYVFPGFASRTMRVRLHFVERYWTTAGNRVFNVSINNKTVLNNFDIVAATGAKNRAIVKEFAAAPNASGQIQIVFTTVKDRALINGIELLPYVSAGEPAPIPVSGLQLWMQADSLQGPANSDGVSRWIDSSGKAYTVSGASGQQPTWQSNVLNGNPAVRFDGSSQYLTLSAGFANWSQGASVFVVTNPFAGNWFAPWFDFGNGASLDNIFLSWDHTYAAGTYFATYPGTNGSGTTSSATIGRYQNLEVVMQAAAQGNWTPTSMYQDGVLLDQGSNLGLANRTRTLNFIAKSNWSDKGMFQGDIAEMILYNRALSNAERQAVESYLRAKYDLP